MFRRAAAGGSTPFRAVDLPDPYGMVWIGPVIDGFDRQPRTRLPPESTTRGGCPCPTAGGSASAVIVGSTRGRQLSTSTWSAVPSATRPLRCSATGHAALRPSRHEHRSRQLAPATQAAPTPTGGRGRRTAGLRCRPSVSGRRLWQGAVALQPLDHLRGARRLEGHAAALARVTNVAPCDLGAASEEYCT